MIAIVSLLTGETYLEVRQAQCRLEERHGLLNPDFSHPHVTYAIGEGDKASDEMIERIRVLAAETDPFTILTAGLGLFPRPSPVLFLPVPRSPELAVVHQAICQAYAGAGDTVHPFYRPEAWLPHVTLANQGVTSEKVPAVMEDLPPECFNLTACLTGFCLIEEVEQGDLEVTREFPFRGQNELGPNPFGLTSRPCQPSDRDFVYRLVEGTLKPLVSAYFSWDEARFERNFRQSWRDKVIVLADGRPAGTIQYDASPADHLYISNLFVAPAAHGRGWGSWLLAHMEGLAQGRSVRLHVWENNPAVRFYQQHGYRIVESEGHKHLMEKR